MKYLLLLPALLLDFVQFMFAIAFLGLQALTPAGAGATGAAAGAYYCYNASTGVIAGLIEAGKCALGGSIVAAGASAAAIPMGMAIDVILSIVVGGPFLFFLALNGYFYWDLAAKGFIGEAIPVFSFLPIWTGITLMMIIRKNKDEKAPSKGLAGVLLGMAAGGGPRAVQVLAQAAPFMNQKRQQLHREFDEKWSGSKEPGPAASRIPLSSKFADIRPAAKGAALALMLAFGFTVSAQAPIEPVQYVVTPEIPGPNQLVTIEVQGIGTFLGDSAIAWRRDGQTVLSGTGERTYSFTTGGLGSVSRVQISIQSAASGSFTKELVFRPSTVSLVWEADTSAPPLFRGKTLYSAGSPLKVAAFPTIIIDGAQVSSGSLSYQWSRAGQALAAQSGLGRNTLTINGDQLQAGEDIAVDVYFGANLVGRSSVFVPATQPHVLVYERDGLRGTLYDLALPGRIELNAKEITLAAQPYNFARPSVLGGAVQYTWYLNDQEIVGPDSARGILTLRQTGSGQGSATLGVELQNNNQDQLVQSARNIISVMFGGTNSGASLFGL